MKKTLIFAAACAVLSASAHAEPAVQSLQLLAAGTPAADSQPLTPQTPKAVSAYLLWSHTWKNLCYDGGRPFSYAGHNYTVRLTFERGGYEAYIKNYIPKTGISISEFRTDTDFTIWSFRTLQEIQSTNVGYTLNDGNVINLKYNGNTLSILATSGQTIASFKFSELLSSWESFARGFSKSNWATLRYFVPQVWWDSVKGWHYGYVVSEIAPLYPNSGLPLDFVELHKEINGPVQFKPIAYSIPLGLIFKRTSNWDLTVSELTEQDLQDAMADELRGGSAGFGPGLPQGYGVSRKESR